MKNYIIALVLYLSMIMMGWVVGPRIYQDALIAEAKHREEYKKEAEATSDYINEVMPLLIQIYLSTKTYKEKISAHRTASSNI